MRKHISFSSGVFLLGAFACVLPAYSQGKGECDKMLTQSEISDATGLTVGKGQAGPKVAGSQGSCVWRGSDGTQIIVVLSGKQQMQTTMDSMAQTGGAEYDGLGTGAVGTQGIPETGGGYNLSFVDSKGGVAVTIPGGAGTSDRTLALGKLIEERRSGKAAGKDKKDTPGGGQVRMAGGQGQTAASSNQGQTAKVH